MTNICIIATIIIYLVAMLLVGFAYSKSNNDSTDFYLGGRKMGPLVTAMSAEASDMSSWLLMGMPGLAYLTGIASPGWTAIGLALGTWLRCVMCCWCSWCSHNRNGRCRWGISRLFQ